MEQVDPLVQEMEGEVGKVPSPAMVIYDMSFVIICICHICHQHEQDTCYHHEQDQSRQHLKMT